MNLEAIRQRWDEERRTLARTGEIIEILPNITRVRGTDGAWHMVQYSCLSEANADQAIAEQVAHYRALGVSFEWKAFAHDGPPDLLRRLAHHGLEIGPLEAVLVLDLKESPAWMREPSPFEVRRIENEAQLDAYRYVVEEVIGRKYLFLADQLRASIESGSKERLGYVAYLDGAPASVGRLYTHPESAFGGLYGGSTLPQYRSRGLYRAIVAARARDAVKLGARYLQVDALPTSRPILERLGFVRLTDTWPCEPLPVTNA